MCQHLSLFDALFGSADLHIGNKVGDSALHVLARNQTIDGRELRVGQGRPDGHDAAVFRFLVQRKGLNPLVEDATGRTALDVAAAEGREAILEVLRSE